MALSLLAALPMSACSDDEPSATAQVCDAREDAGNAAADLRSSIADGDLAGARDALGALGTALAEMRSLSGALATEERERLQPQIDRIETAIAGLRDVTSVADLGDQLQTVGAEIDATLDLLRSDLRCT